jgi:hypothetical protein
MIFLLIACLCFCIEPAGFFAFELCSKLPTCTTVCLPLVENWMAQFAGAALRSLWCLWVEVRPPLRYMAFLCEARISILGFHSQLGFLCWARIIRLVSPLRQLVLVWAPLPCCFMFKRLNITYFWTVVMTSALFGMMEIGESLASRRPGPLCFTQDWKFPKTKKFTTNTVKTFKSIKWVSHLHISEEKEKFNQFKERVSQ